jgi:hypothetical protein
MCDVRSLNDQGIDGDVRVALSARTSLRIMRKARTANYQLVVGRGKPAGTASWESNREFNALCSRKVNIVFIRLFDPLKT